MKRMRGISSWLKTQALIFPSISRLTVVKIMPRIQSLSGEHAPRRGVGGGPKDAGWKGESTWKVWVSWKWSKKRPTVQGMENWQAVPQGCRAHGLLQPCSSGRWGRDRLRDTPAGCRLCASVLWEACSMMRTVRTQFSAVWTHRETSQGESNLTVSLLLAWEALWGSGNSSRSTRRLRTEALSSLCTSPVPGRPRCQGIETSHPFIRLFNNKFVLESNTQHGDYNQQ